MTAPPRTDPPYVPIRHTRWPTRRTPRPVLLLGIVLLAGAVLVALVHRPSPAQRAADLRGFLADMNTGIESCAGGVGESLGVLHQVESGDRRDLTTAIYIAQYGASNCSLANSEPLDDLSGYQVTESLASFRLGTVVTGLTNWATPDAQDVQTDVAQVLAARNQRAKSQAMAALSQALGRLDAQRSAVDSVIEAANRALSAHASPPVLPG
jgi:hypothetical protein